MSLSKQYPVETLDTECTRSVRKVTGSHKFRIMVFSLDKDINGKGKVLESTIFTVGGYDWSIRYYPNGSSKAEDGEISIFLTLKSQAEGVKAQYSFTILDQSGSALVVETADITTFSGMANSWGYVSFAKRPELVSKIKDDCFIIEAVVTVFKVFPVERTGPIIVPPGNILQQLRQLLKHRNGADVTFEVDGTTFNAHKCILAARSPVFSAQFFGAMKEKSDTVIKIEEIDAPVFKSLLYYIYNDSLPELEEASEKEEEEEQGGLMETIETEEKDASGKMAQHLLVAADRYGLDRLKTICEKILWGSIDKSNVVGLLVFAEQHSCSRLRTACLKYLVTADFIGEVFETEEFQKLVKNDPLILKELLQKRS